MDTFQKIFASASLIIVLGLSYISCQKEILGIVTPENPVNDLEKTNASVQGYITLENGSPAIAAQVISGGNTTTTSAKGYFRFNNIQLSKNNGYVEVTLPGYFKGSRSFVTATGRVHEVRIQLIPKIQSGSFTATAGGTVSLTSALSIIFPGNSIVIAGTSTPYSGQVDVFATWIDPTGNALLKQMPGDLRGITSSGLERGLETFGMMAAELRGSGGQTLAITAGKKATINFPIPTSLGSLAPNSIPLWHFDEIAGRWKEEGIAVKNGNIYIAEVSHFSFWNCDAPFPLVTFTATIVNNSNTPLAHTLVRIKKVSNNSMGSGYTDSTGFVTGKIPANEPLILEVFDQCGSPVYSQNIGPFSANTNLGIITINNSTVSILNISGLLLNCSNSPVTFGYADILINNHFYRANVINGNYQISITNCASNSTFIVSGIDQGTNQQSNPQTISITSQNVTVPPIQACGVSTLQSIDYTIDGLVFNITSPPDSITVFGQGSTINGTFISGYNILNLLNSVSFQIYGNPVTGPHPLAVSRINDLDSVTTLSPTVNITLFGNVGGFIEGNFAVQMRKSSTNTLHAVTCSFRVRRR